MAIVIIILVIESHLPDDAIWAICAADAHISRLCGKTAASDRVAVGSKSQMSRVCVDRIVW